MSFAPEIREHHVVLPVTGKDGSVQTQLVKYSKRKPPFLGGNNAVEVTFSKDKSTFEEPIYLNKKQLEKWISAIGQGPKALANATPQLRGRLISQYAGCKTRGPKTPAKPQAEKNRTLSPGARAALFQDDDEEFANSSDVDTVGGGSNRSDTPPSENSGAVASSNADVVTRDNDTKPASPPPVNAVTRDNNTKPAPPTPVVPRHRSKKANETPPETQQSLSSATKAKIATAVLVTSVALGALAVYLDPLGLQSVRTVDSFWDIGSISDVWLYLGY